ncbi:phosphate ABC transporter substrate-binding protein PstS [Alicyclobacillus ferrooxydans]|uniref:Phosphate-binding protein n=1 Tax=Alicyclobacillus ferrooxydans TaxID=471514 RepID=A0A0P9EHZ0_9BACL|nr:phosphate ABC transporter substrate-binding protein PstS [Alicyclobacillus ferrooxydans]KPV42354.1 phosphate-binding protein [Alicyclobacillus ferrooxydans]
MKQSGKWIAVSVTAAGLIASLAGCGTGAGNNTSGSGTAGNASGNATGTSASGAVTLNETGSSLLYPLFNNQWIAAYQSVDPSVKLTAASTGSGTGISQAIAGTVQIGASDAYMSDAQIAQSPNMLNIPLAISAQQIMYNLPGVKGHLKLTGDVLGQIYLGKITYWDDAAIKALNPGVSLPHKPIVPVRRTDGSGDTFLFTQFLSDTNKTWGSSSGPNYGTSISWPAVASEVGAKGNDGVVSQLANTPYSIGYVGISWLDKATQKGLGYAALQNKSGNFVLPTQANIQAAASTMVSQVPASERISLIYSPGANSYPIINFEYAIVNKQQSGATAAALKKFLNWAISPSGGDSSQYMTPVHFLPLPASVAPKSQAQINQIGS